MFKQRLISGIVLVIIILFLVIKGGFFLLGGLCVIAAIGLLEFYRVFKIDKSVLDFIGFVASILCLYFSSFSNSSFFVLLTIICAFVFEMFAYVFCYPKYDITKIMAAVFGIIYVPIMLSYIYHLRMIEGTGKYVVWLVFFCSWGCDTCAYCAGRLFGKYKMAPVLSPKKTIEGAVGGVIGTVILVAVYCYIFRDVLVQSSLQFIIILVACCLGALISMVGDLAASAIKRNYDIKDYGNVIPGHGGILDRFDSVIIVAPIIYYVYMAYQLNAF